MGNSLGVCKVCHYIQAYYIMVIKNELATWCSRLQVHAIKTLEKKLYTEKWAFTELYIIFLLILAKKHRLWVVVRTVFMCLF